jgi:hypothetical protein
MANKKIPDKELMVQFRVNEERKRKLKAWVGEHGTSIKALAEHGLDLAMSEDKTKRHKNAPKMVDTNEPGRSYNLHIPEYREWVEFVVDIFNSGNRDHIDGLIANIRAFKLGNKFDELTPMFAHILQLLEPLLKKEGAAPDATLTTALTQATDLSRTLARARDTLKHLQADGERIGKTRPERAV